MTRDSLGKLGWQHRSGARNGVPDDGVFDLLRDTDEDVGDCLWLLRGHPYEVFALRPRLESPAAVAEIKHFRRAGELTRPCKVGEPSGVHEVDEEILALYRAGEHGPGALNDGRVRYGVLMQYPNKIRATEEFFGKGKSAVVDLPRCIDHLIRSMPLGHLYTADELIDKHTLFPFYAPFLAKNRARLIREIMRLDDSAQVGPRVTRARQGKKAIYLRYCLECAREDRASFGETYWHRLHQLHGVDACSRHEVFLEATAITWKNGSNHAEAKAAELLVKDSPSRKLDTSNPVHLIHTRIAQVAFFLLNNVRDSIDCEILSERYKNLLLRQGLAHFNGDVRITKLINKIKEYYPAEILTKLGCEIQTDKNWVTRLVSKRQADDLQHPICHVLLLIFLDRNPEEIFDRFVEFKPFGDGPWPCLNPAVDHYKEPQVHDCKIFPGAKKDRRKPRGVFSCYCGFTYARTGPDIKEEDRFTSTIVQAYGKSWEALLRELWDDKSFSIDKIARRLGISILTLKRRVVAMGLRFPRWAGTSNGNKDILSRYKLRREPKQSLLKRKKKEWVSLITANPTIGRAELWRSTHSLYSYLSNADPQWLKRHLPPCKQVVPRPRELDWAKEDSLLAKAVASAVIELNKSEPPMRITVAAISNLTGQSSRLKKRLDKMPKTASLLNSHLESIENFVVRRILWIAESFRREQVVPTKTAFIRRALIESYVTARNEVICRTLEDALLKLGSNIQKSRL